MSGTERRNRQCIPVPAGASTRGQSSPDLGPAECARYGNAVMAERAVTEGPAGEGMGGPGTAGYGVLLDTSGGSDAEHPGWAALPDTGDIASQPTQREMDREVMSPAPSQTELDWRAGVTAAEEQQRIVRERRARNRRIQGYNETLEGPERPASVHQQGALFGIPFDRWIDRQRPTEGNMGGDSGDSRIPLMSNERGETYIGVHHTVGHGVGRDGEDEYGVRLNAGVFTNSRLIDGEYPVDTQASALSGDLGIYANDHTLTVGAQAAVAEGALQVGRSDPESATDWTARGGASEGPGLAFRAHYGDADGDGVRETGIGADIGPVSFDVTTEEWHLTAQRLGLVDSP